MSAVKRTILFILMFIAVLILPWWLSLLIFIGLTIYIPLYLEVLFFGLLFDTIYSPQYDFPYTALAIAFVILMAVTIIRPRIRVQQF